MPSSCTYDAYVARVGHAVDFDTFFAANVYHVPFGGLAQRAHFRLARREMDLSKAEAECHWEKKSKASLTYNRRTGGVYGAATFVALAGLIDPSPELAAGDRIGIYSYGSGSCAEFYSVTAWHRRAGRGCRGAHRAAALGPPRSQRRRIRSVRARVVRGHLLRATTRLQRI